MSTSILYHGFGIVGYRYKSTSYQEGDLVFTIEKDRTSLRCPCCKSGEVSRRGALPRWFKTVPIGSKRVLSNSLFPVCSAESAGLFGRSTLGLRMIAVPTRELLNVTQWSSPAI